MMMWARALAALRQTHRGFSGLRNVHVTVQRDARYAVLQQDDVSFFSKLLGDTGVITDVDKLPAYNKDWMHKYEGKSQVVLRPKTTQQVSDILTYCSDRRLALVPQGGNTGLVGGSVPVFDEVILSQSSMNKVISFDEASGALVCQAGCVLQMLDDFAAQHGFMMPLDLGAKGSCQIGGNVSTNAGGLRLLRYGSLHGSVLGLEVVLADGRVLDLLRELRKDNTGYDLKQLFIGAEGSLGVVTAVAVQCAPRPGSVQLVFLACDSFAQVQKVLASSRKMLSEILSAVEFLDAECMQMAVHHLEGVSNPLPNSNTSSFYMLIETHGSNPEHDMQKLEAFLESVMSDGSVTDGIVSQSETQSSAIWRVREGLSEALVRRGAVYKYDLSMPVADMYLLVEELRQRLKGFDEVGVVGYGHVGDGNLHLNVSAPHFDDAILDQIEPFVYEWTTRHRGSISAEHGIGIMKAECLGYSKPQSAIHIMANMKGLLDPQGILNPYKVLPRSALQEIYGAGHATVSSVRS